MSEHQELKPEDFIEAGYRKFKDSSKQYAQFGLQKKITDDLGVMYFITIYAYNWEDIPAYNRKWSFQTSLQFNTEDSYLNLEWPVDDIQKTEDKAQKFWEFCGKNYYEKYGEEA